MESNIQPEFSLGSTKLMESIEKLLTDRMQLIDVVCLNIGTIIRNCQSNQKVQEAIEFDKLHGVQTENPSTVLVSESKEEFIKMINDVVQMLNNSTYVDNPFLVIYHSDYSKSIPKNLYKPPTDSKYYLTKADDIFSRDIVKGNKKIKRSGKTVVIELPINNNFLPWRHISVEMKDMRNNHNVLMVSNHPVDYHLGSVSRTFRIVRSFTGAVVNYKQLGQIVFNNNVMPFNVYTHALLGDKEDIKCTLSTADKRNLIKLAEQEEWMLKTKDFIRDRLYKLGIRIPTTF